MTCGPLLGHQIFSSIRKIWTSSKLTVLLPLSGLKNLYPAHGSRHFSVISQSVTCCSITTVKFSTGKTHTYLNFVLVCLSGTYASVCALSDFLLVLNCSYILEAREMPMLSMLEAVFYKIVQRILTKQKEPDKWTGTICPKIKKKLDKLIEWSSNCMVLSAGGGEYKVSSGETEREYAVDLKTKSCDCKRWQLSGIPCHHALACCRTDRIDPESLVHSCYSIETYKKAYKHNLHPLRGRVFWEKMNGVKVHPPLYTKVMGRPKKNRKKAIEEKIKHGAPTLSRHGLTMHCSICGKPDHNMRGHDKYMLSLQVEQVLEETDPLELEDGDDPSYLQVIFTFACP